MCSKNIYKTDIIGAGPSSIAIAENLIKKGDNNFIILDKGSHERSHDIKHDVFNGFGGASLYSDGKISFKPSGTNVWKLNDQNLIKKGLEYTLDKFEVEKKVKTEILEGLSESEIIDNSEHKWIYKEYKSMYVPLDKRMEIINNSYNVLENNYKGSVYVYKVTETNNFGRYAVHYQINDDFITKYVIYCDNVICSGGRYMPLFLNLYTNSDIQKEFKRIEFGVRISCTAENDIWKLLKGTDPKYIYKEDGLEWRTFCCCRDGMVVKGSYNSLVTYSGRADCPKTGVSNIGFNLRIYDPTKYSMFMKEIENVRLSKTKTFQLNFEEFSKLDGEIYKMLLKGLTNFIEFTGIDKNILTINGPTIEGIGYYWPIDNNLKIINENIWVVGDATGIFRGLTASMVSGHYVSEQIDLPKCVIKNQIMDDINYSQTYPEITGASGKALQEIHIFLEPINPSDAYVDKFNKLVEKYNKIHNYEKPMKACHLALEFIEPKGTVRVLQSSRYILSNNTIEVVGECHKDAVFFAENGFNVLREKIEATVHGNNGVPKTTNEMKNYPHKYFEYHIRITDVDNGVLDQKNLDELLIRSNEMSKKFGIPIPFSYNKSKGSDGLHQKYLNVRFRKIGSIEANEHVMEIKKGIEELEGFKVSKIISEYVWYDTFPELDKGWIDF